MSECRAKQDMTIWASRGHGHLTMRSMYMEHFGADGGARRFGVIPRFDYNYQPVSYVDGGAVAVGEGDLIRSHCIFNTEGRTRAVSGGESTSDEMCINYVFFYPLLPEVDWESPGAVGSCIDWDAVVEGELERNPLLEDAD